MIWRKLLAPFSLLWWIIVSIRNFLYKVKMFPVKSFKYPIIVVGNLSVGGTGKTPHTAYILNLLKDYFKVGVLSRGYGRKTSGFIVANYDSNAKQIGDEPMLFFNRFKNRIVVCVGESRVEAIKKMLKIFPLNTIVLDDAYQHRALKAGFYVLLTEYKNRYSKDYVLPMGNLREPRRGADRAKFVVVTKCPDTLNEEEKINIRQELKLKKHQHLFFSKIKYDEKLYHRDFDEYLEKFKNYNVLLVTGIADSSYLKEFVDNKFAGVKHIKYPDHYSFNPSDIKEIDTAFQSMAEPKIILTTEKDYMRLRREYRILENLYYLPITVELDQPDKFNQIILSYVQKFSRSGNVYSN